MCENLKPGSPYSEFYKEVHGGICLSICIFGAIANLLNIIVLTRKEMNGSPINRILAGNHYISLMFGISNQGSKKLLFL